MTSSDKLRVLLVEDSVLIVEQLRELLQSTPCEPDVAVASTEDEALATAESYDPHVVIVDLKLRQGTGFGVLRTLCESQERPVLIVLTNYALPQYREFAKLIGADFFLDKSSDTVVLADILNSIPTDDSNKPTIVKH
jgi:two-component system OmpR family response regulator